MTSPTSSPQARATDPTGTPATDPTRTPATDPTRTPATDPTGTPSVPEGSDGVLTVAAPEAEPAPDAEELARLRSEVSALRTTLDKRKRRASVTTTIRRIAAAVLVAITAFALVFSVVGLWAARTTLDTDRWVATVGPLPEDPQVVAAVSDYATTQIFEVVNVEQRLQEVLPPQAAFVAGPLTGQIREAVQKSVTNVLQSDQFHTIWVEMNRRAHQRALAIIEGTSDVVVAREDRVDIDLLPLINQVLRALSTQLPTMFGKQITLPDLSSGEIPENLRVRVEEALGVTLPANFAQFTIYNADELWAAQQAALTAKRGLVAFVIGTIVLLALALLISPRRRRTVLQLGLWLVIAAVAVTAVLRAVRTQILEQVPAGIYRDGVGATLTIVFSMLRERGQQLIWIGAILALVAYLVGPGRIPVWLRRKAVVGARHASRWIRREAHASRTHGPGWISRNLDVIRIAGAVVAVALALILSSWTSLLVIVLLLIAFEVAVTLIGRSAEREAEREAPPSGLDEVPTG